MSVDVETPWAQTVDDLLKALDSDRESGLSSELAAARLAQCGPNKLESAARPSALTIFFRQFADWLIALLLVAAIVSGVIGSWEDSLLIAAIVLANAIIGLVQELRAEEAVAALKALSQPIARVRRGRVLRDCPTEELVPGDLIEVDSGDIVPADGRVLEAVDLQVNEASLTGESLPVEKVPQDLPRETPLAERTNVLHSGSAVVRGHAHVLITATGGTTELGKIADLLEKAEDTGTPLQRQLARLSKWLGLAVLTICTALFAAGWLRGMPAEQMFLTAVSLAVAAIPEGLPAIITVTLALGARRMATRKAIMRRLATVETLGAVNVICSDKTGTITQNRMHAADINFASEAKAIRELFWQAAVLCNNATEASSDDEQEFEGSPTEVAILQAAVEAGTHPSEIRRRQPRMREFAFHADRKRMSTVHRADDVRLVIYAKGAVERLLDAATQVATADGPMPLSTGQRQQIVEESSRQARRGRRMIGLAYRSWQAKAVPESADDAETELVWLGSFGLVDPPRDEARTAIAECRSAGVRLVMITGDHIGTAEAIAEDVQLLESGMQAIDGAQLDQLSEDQLQADAGRIGIYARVTPGHKIRIVKALQSGDTVVAMTGDGVNDAPALKQADIGVAMGITGTEVSKQASDMILADDNLATLAAAIEEGRAVYDNIRKFVRYLLTTNAGEVLLMSFAVIWGFAAMPLLPIHLLWINLVTDGLPALALGFEAPETFLMKRRPRSREESLFAHGLGLNILLMGLLVAAVCLAIWFYFAGRLTSGDAESLADPWAYSRTAVFTTLACSQLLYVFTLQSSVEPAWSRRLWQNYRLVIAVVLGFALQLGLIYVPFTASVFHLVPLAFADLGLVLGVACIPLVVGEIIKAIRNRLRRQRHLSHA